MITQFYIPTKLQGIVNYIIERRMDGPGQFTFSPNWECEVLFILEGCEEGNISSSKLEIDRNLLAKNFCWISGLTTGPTMIKFKKLNSISILISPIALKALFNIPTYKLNNSAILAEDFIPDLKKTEDKLNTLPNFQAKAKWLEENLLTRIYESAELKTAFGIYNLVLKLTNENRSYTPGQIEKMLGYSKTQSFRIFNEWFGLSITKFQKLIRFVHTVDYIHKSSDSLTQIGIVLGYYDQAHFIRTFKEFTGLTPKQYLKLKTDTPGIFPY
ncbi:MAG: helix-turn-helix domain-containing protein [Ignavibacteriaceae bacterium]